MAQLLSANVGLPREIDGKGGPSARPFGGRGPGSPKRTEVNIDGDGQANLRGHGGEHRAVFVYQIVPIALEAARAEGLRVWTFGETSP